MLGDRSVFGDDSISTLSEQSFEPAGSVLSGDYHSDLNETGQKHSVQWITSFLCKTMNNHGLCDFKIIHGNHVYKIHKVVLAAYSPKYAAIFDTVANMDNVTVNNVKESTLQQVINFLYTGKLCRLENSDSEDFKNCCNQLFLQGVFPLMTPESSSSSLSASMNCYSSVSDTEEKQSDDEIDAKNAISLFFSSEDYKVSQAAMSFIHRNLDTVSNTPDFLRLRIDDIITLLKNDEMRKVSQVTLFQALRKWTNFDSQNRKHLVGRAIECVEFRSMSVQALSAEVESSDLMSIASCRKMLFDAYKYHALIQSKTSLTSESSPSTNPPSNVEVSSSPDKMVSSPVVERVHRPQGSPQVLKAVSPIRKSQKSFCKVKQTRNVKQGKLLAICGTHIFELMESGIKLEWIQITKIPRSRSYPAIAYFDGCLFVIGGQDSETKKVTNKVWKYNLLTSQWEEGIPLQEARDYAAAAVIGNTLYVVGGMSNDPKMKRNMLHSMEIYTSHKKGWNYAAPASASTIGATVVSSGKFLYRIGGYDGTTTLQHLEVYDPKKDRWYMKAPMIANLGYASGALVGDDFYLLGGVYVQHRQSHQAIIHMNNIFKLHNSQWIHVSRAGTPRYNSGVIVLNKRIYLLGGYQTKDDAKLTSVECFDTELKDFVESDIPSLPKGGAVVCCVVPRDQAP